MSLAMVRGNAASILACLCALWMFDLIFAILSVLTTIASTVTGFSAKSVVDSQENS